MKEIKRLVIMLAIVSLVINTMISCKQYENDRSVLGPEYLKPVKISVFEYRADDSYSADVSKNLKKIEAENPEKVQFTFYDSKDSQALQNENIDKAIQEGTDLLLVNLVDIREGQTVINRIKENNLPVILYNREPFTLDPIRSYSKALFIGSNVRDCLLLQAQILIDEWNTNKKNIDRNNDGIMQYVRLTGGTEGEEKIFWWRSTVEIIERAGIKTEELAVRVANFDEELAKKEIESIFLRYENKIEAIISDDDTMAIGAIKALQQFGYNKDSATNIILVVGMDAEEEARQLIEEGLMTGSVIQSPSELSKALYSVGINMVNKRNPIEGTPYVFDETRVSIRIPCEGIFVKNKN